MLETLEDLDKTPSKTQELLRVLEKRRRAGGRIEQTVIFTHFYDTLTDLVSGLRHVDRSILIGTFSGKGGQYVDPQTRELVGVDREEIKQMFLRGEIDVLICTDAAAEGLNLQTANLLINFDLPWNPMKVEQRIGRIDRIGQKHDEIYVLNLCYAGSVEETVYGRLLQRLTQTEYVVGTQQISLLPVTEEDFSQLASGELSPQRLESIAKERISLQRQRTESMEIPASDLYQIYLRMSRDQNRLESPVTLESIWQAVIESRFLKDLGSVVSNVPSRQTLSLRGLTSIPDETLITVDRQLYETGLENGLQRLHFFTYGGPIFEAVMEELDEHDLPNCVEIFREKLEDLETKVVAFAVSSLDESGQAKPRLLTSWKDLKDLQLAENIPIDTFDLRPLQERLRDLVRREFDPTRAVKRIERINQQSAVAQEILDLLVARSLFDTISKSQAENFWTSVKYIEDLLQERDRLNVASIPVEYLQRIVSDLAIELRPPKMGQDTTITVPTFIVACAVDATCRLADGMKVKKSELTVGRVLDRIGREIERKMKAFRSIAV